MKRESGFTLIELVVVIVILGILAATALPKFIDLSGDAKQAAVDGVAGALSSAAAVNYGARKASSAKGTAVAGCSAVAATLQGGLPTGYSITSAVVGADASVSCKVNGATGYSASFTAIGIS